MNIISNIQISAKIVSVDGDIVSLVLIILLSISFLLSNTKYWNTYTSNTLNMLYDPMVWIFIGMVVFKIIIAIKP